jgi:hypothetical protein
MESSKQNSYLKEYILKCPICYEQFSNIHKPLIIPCGHTICSLCVENIKKIAEEEYDEDYSSDVGDQEYDISLDTDEENEQDESSIPLEESEHGESDHDQSGSESEEEEDEDEDEEDENSVVVDEPIYPSQSLLTQQIDGNQENLNQINQIVSHAQPVTTHRSDKKIKLKCSICRKKMKIFEDEIMINSSVMDFINSFHNASLAEAQTLLNKIKENSQGKENKDVTDSIDKIDKSIPIEKHNAEHSNKIQNPVENKIFCRFCRIVDIASYHLINHGTHEPYFIKLTSEEFSKFKSNCENFEEKGEEIVNKLTEININTSTDFSHFSHLKDQNSLINTQISDSLQLFFTELIKSSEFLKDSKDYMKNYFQVNSKASFLKHKSYRKLTKLYIKFNKVISEIDSLEPLSDKESDNKISGLNKKGEEILENTNTLLDKYFRLTDIYLKNYEKIFIKNDGVKTKNTEITETTQKDDFNDSEGKYDFSNITEKLYIDKIKNHLRTGFFEAYMNKIVDSERRYATCIDNSDNQIYIFDMRIENELEVDYSIMFDRMKESGQSQDDIEGNFSDYIEVDEDGRRIYILGKRAKDSKTFRSYDMNTRTLNEEKKMPQKFGITDRYYVNNKLFILGGATTDLTPIVKCYYYDTQAAWWFDLPNLNLNKYNKSIAFNYNKFYVFGGSASDRNSDTLKFEVLDMTKISQPDFKWQVFTVKKFNEFLMNSFYGFISHDVFVILAGVEATNYDEVQKGYIIKFDETDWDNSEVIEEFKIKNTMVNSFNALSYYRGLMIGSRLGDGYFTKMRTTDAIKIFFIN